MPKSGDLIEILNKRYGIDIKTDPEIQQFRELYHIAQLIYDARITANLTHAQLAEKVGVTEDVISDIEEADFGGDVFSMLHRIALVLNRKVEIRLAPEPPESVAGV